MGVEAEKSHTGRVQAGDPGELVMSVHLSPKARELEGSWLKPRSASEGPRTRSIAFQGWKNTDVWAQQRANHPSPSFCSVQTQADWVMPTHPDEEP